MSLPGGSCQSDEGADKMSAERSDPNPGILQLWQGLGLALARSNSLCHHCLFDLGSPKHKADDPDMGKYFAGWGRLLLGVGVHGTQSPASCTSPRVPISRCSPWEALGLDADLANLL